jgi:nicotinate-nucleotide adenylyltransferase
VGVGVLGGAFDPPHDGHVALAQGAVAHFGLTRLLVRVVAAPGHRSVAATADDRLALAELAFASVGDAEVALDPHARTVDSLEALNLADPVFLIGADELASFPSWKEPDRVLELARLGVATRPGVGHERLDAVIAELSDPSRVELFEIEQLPISSSEIRARVADREPIADLVPASVAAEIERRGLYRRATRLH